MPDFATLITDARKFHSTLAKNNNREWWGAHKDTYDTQLKAPALSLIERLTPEIADLSGLPVTGKLFRAHRDVRFSKDKTPFNTHLHMIWMAKTEGLQDVAFFFGIGQDYVSAGGGIMSFEKPTLENWRLFVDQDQKRILKIVERLKADQFTLREPALKRVPSGYDKDHPAGDLLRMKGCVASRELGQTATVETDVLAAFAALWPLNNLLIQIVEA
ncbi:TIGR02453 family protein [Cognatiyoonia koreensis]|uniref:TIGR02453 family protein n=1 Tax=Cognatiyoonia koreensis TaxID=364200 RepID=A0A1I0Q8X1_9RHOB|nr:DUF2461 domain-containing protein [Cognatiyoonia koreensis]SEW23450.1 TIGR02453 family protein [Cognatiyoonia koreensis]